jgi:hypothetical protein
VCGRPHTLALDTHTLALHVRTHGRASVCGRGEDGLTAGKKRVTREKVVVVEGVRERETMEGGGGDERYMERERERERESWRPDARVR